MQDATDCSQGQAMAMALTPCCLPLASHLLLTWSSRPFTNAQLLFSKKSGPNPFLLLCYFCFSVFLGHRLYINKIEVLPTGQQLLCAVAATFMCCRFVHW